MRILAIALISLCVSLCTSHAEQLTEVRLIGDWVIDVERTEAYLRGNAILTDTALKRMHPILARLHLIYGPKTVRKMEDDGQLSPETEYTIIVASDAQTVFTSKDKTGNAVRTIITWDGDAFWQETSMFPNYRERFVRPKQAQTKAPNNSTSP